MFTNKKKLVLSGAFWNSINSFGAQIFNVLVTIVLARYLVPEDFGLVFTAVMSVAVVSFFCEFGLIYALIKADEVSNRDKTAAFFISCNMTVFVVFFVWILSDYIGLFFNDSRVSEVIVILALCYLVVPLSVLPEALEKREMRFKKISITSLVAFLVSGSIAMLAVVNGEGYKAIIYHIGGYTVLKSLILSLSVPWAFSFEFDINFIKRYLGFGWRICLQNMQLYLAENMDNFFMSKFFGKFDFGLYSVSYRLSRYPVEKVKNIFGSMIYPLMARDHSDEGIYDVLVKSAGYYVYLIWPVFIFVMASGQWLITNIIGEQWLDSYKYLKIFCVMFMIESLFYGAHQALICINKLKQLNYLLFVSVLITFCGCMVAVYFEDPIYIAYSMLLGKAFYAISSFLYVSKFIKKSVFCFLKKQFFVVMKLKYFIALILIAGAYFECGCYSLLVLVLFYIYVLYLLGVHKSGIKNLNFENLKIGSI